MRAAWIDPAGVVRDVAPVGMDPHALYTPEIAAAYDTLVPDHVENGAALVDGEWINPAPPVIPDPPPPPPRPVPQVVSPLAARLALRRAGLLDAVEAALAQPTTPEEYRIAWEYATELHRTDPMVASIGALIGLSDAEIDDLFRAAGG